MPGEGSLAAPLKVVADLQRQGLVRHIGLSNVTRTQFKEARAIAEIVCVQNQYNLGHRGDEASLTLPQDAVTKLDGIGR